MSKNILGSKNDKKYSLWLYMCNFKLKKRNYFSSTYPFIYNYTFEIHKAR